jgi:hypothetical protein
MGKTTDPKIMYFGIYDAETMRFSIFALKQGVFVPLKE